MAHASEWPHTDGHAAASSALSEACGHCPHTVVHWAALLGGECEVSELVLEEDSGTLLSSSSISAFWLMKGMSCSAMDLSLPLLSRPIRGPK